MCLDEDQLPTCSKSDKRLFNSSKYEEDFPWLYMSHQHRGWMCKVCEKYPYAGGRSKGAFSTRPCANTTHPSLAFKKHEKSSRHKRLEEKLLSDEGTDVYSKIIISSEKQKKSRFEINRLYMQKCIHTIFYMVRKHMALTGNYGDMIDFMNEKLHEPIMEQYLSNCPLNATYKSDHSAESILDAINVYFETINLKEINDANFIAIYADESENSSHKECFSIFATFYSQVDKIVKTRFLGIMRLTRLRAADIMDVLMKFLSAKNIDVKKILFSVLDGTNTMSGKKSGLQRRIRHESPFNIYINCRCHRLALCFPHLMKHEDFKDLLVDFDCLLLGLWKLFHYSPKKGGIFESIQQTYGKKPLKILKACVTRWLTHGLACKRILARYEDLLVTLDHLCKESYEADIRGYRIMLTSHQVVFVLCLMADVLTILNTLSLFLQKENRKYTDIKISLSETVSKFEELSKVESHAAFKDILADSYYARVNDFINIISEHDKQSRSLSRSTRAQSNMTIDEFHSEFGKPLMENLITELNEAFQTDDFPVLDALHSIDPRYVTKSPNLESAECLFAWYGENKVDVFEGRRNEAPKLLKCSKEMFLREYEEYISFICQKKEQELKNAEKELRDAEKELSGLRLKKNTRVKILKACEKKVKITHERVKDPVTPELALETCRDVFPNMTMLLEIILVCPSSGAVVERGFSVMNLAMNKLQSSMNITTLDAIMRINYEDGISDDQANVILDIWKKRGDRRIELT